MLVNVIYADQPPVAVPARIDGAALRLTPHDLAAATGWELKPEGLCRGAVCVPVTPARRAAYLDASGDIDATAFARDLGHPVVHDVETQTWLFGAAAATRRDALRSLEAPDFTLPDLDGTPHALRAYRGKKVLLLSWASW